MKAITESDWAAAVIRNCIGDGLVMKRRPLVRLKICFERYHSGNDRLHSLDRERCCPGELSTCR